MGEDRLDGLVEDRDGQAVQVRGDGHDHVATGEGLLPRQPPARTEQLAGQLVEVDHWALVGGTGGLDRGGESLRRVTSSGQLGLPAADQILDENLLLAVPGGPGRDRPGRVGGIGPTAAVIWAERVECSSQTSAGIPAIAQPPSRPDGPGSASIPYPSSTALAAPAMRPTAVAACRWSRTKAVSGAFQPPRASRIYTALAIRT